MIKDKIRGTSNSISLIEEQTIFYMYQQGKSFKDIAKILSKTEKEVKKLVQSSKKYYSLKEKRDINLAQEGRTFIKGKKLPPKIVQDVIQDSGDFKHKSLAELKSKECRYPQGSVTEGNLTFCGCKTYKDTSYCVKHYIETRAKIQPKYK